MSLINQMLQDLEARSTGFGDGDLRRLVSQDLRAAPALRRSRLLWPGLATLSLLAVLVAVRGTDIALMLQQGLRSLVAVDAVPATAQTPAPAAAVEATVDATGVNDAAIAAASAIEAEPVAGSTAVVPPATVDDTPAQPAPVDAPVISKTPHAVSAAEQAEQYYHEGAVLLEQGRLADAERTLMTGLRISPWHVEARELLVRVHLQLGNIETARGLLRRGMQRVPGHLGFSLMLARLEVDAGREAEALAGLEAIADSAGNDADYLAMLATLYQRSGRHDDAAARYRGALAQRPAESRWWVGLGISLEASSQWPAARDAFIRARQAGRLEPMLAQYVSTRLAALERLSASGTGR